LKKIRGILFARVRFVRRLSTKRCWCGNAEKILLSESRKMCIMLTSSEIRIYCPSNEINASVAEPHHFYAAPAPGKNFDAAPAPAAPAPAPTLSYSKAKFLKRTEV
jgi:hypothetical protein